ncbi:MAG: SDR family NAD(P)-dependent oxidoreductase [Burkholderiales bacterium]|nr:SDR family NAD(P)-dependent oxidoreductase [Burkholderiales bacterium]
MIELASSPRETVAASYQKHSGRGLFGALNPPQADWRGRTVWVVGASSGIGRATASALHAAGAQVVLSARNEEALRDFTALHPGSLAVPLDVADREGVRCSAQAILASGPIDMVMYCAGYYREQRATAFSLQEMLHHQQVNYVGALHVLDAVLPHFLARQRGHISLVSSVAGFRGLPKSLAYGPTKAALINLAEALYLDLQGTGIGVSLVNPGFVETPLTAQNQFSMPALITPEKAAREILRGWRRGQFEIHFPRRFTLAMKLLRLLPFRLYQAAVRRATGG